MLIKLPNGLLDGADLFNYAEIDELRGKQQNYLADKDLIIGNIGHVPKILSDMLLSLQTKEGLTWKGQSSEAIYKLPSGDLETILIKVRENTYGPKFFHEAECVHCEYVNKGLRLDLDKLELDVLSLEDMVEEKVITLPKSELEVELKPAYLKDIFEVVKITKNKSSTLITSLIATSVKRLGEKTKITSEDIDTIPASDLAYLQETAEQMQLEGSIDTTIEITCKKCKEDFEVKLNSFDASFFDPTRGSKS